MDTDYLDAIILTLNLAGTTTIVLIVVATPLALWLANTRSRFKAFVKSLVAMPLVLPPTVLGFYLLLALNPKGLIGKLFISLGLEAPVFNFSALLIGSIIYSMPFVVQPLEQAFNAIGTRPVELAATLGAGPLDRFFSVLLPLAWPGYMTAAILGFAHTVGEFGVVLMIGGNIPGSTQVLSIFIYDRVEALDYAVANYLALSLVVFSFTTLLAVYTINSKFRPELRL